MKESFKAGDWVFTGLIEELGQLKNIKKGVSSAVLSIAADKVLEDTKIGDSIAVNGVCLTVTGLYNSYFTADVMHETLNASSMSSLKIGDNVNLERAMALGKRFGGHIVSGHIDGTGIIDKIEKDDNAIWFHFTVEHDIMRYVVMKGSVTIDGISLTVAKVDDYGFMISAIPHTVKETTLSYKGIGDKVNIETDIIGRYVEHLMAFDKEEVKSGITREFLLKNGF